MQAKYTRTRGQKKQKWIKVIPTSRYSLDKIPVCLLKLICEFAGERSAFKFRTLTKPGIFPDFTKLLGDSLTVNLGTRYKQVSLSAIRSLSSSSLRSIQFTWWGGSISISDVFQSFTGNILLTLESINMIGCLIDSKTSIQSLLDFPNLKSLNLGWTNINNDQMGIIAQHPNIVELSLSECHQITDITLYHLSMMPNLQKLCLSCKGEDIIRGQYPMKITDKGMMYLAKSTSLIDLDVTGCTYITNIGIQYIGYKLPQIERFKIWGLGRVSESDLQVFDNHPPGTVLFRFRAKMIRNKLIDFSCVYPGLKI